MVLGGLADLYAATKDAALLTAGAGVADAVLQRETTGGILVEPEAINRQDAALFKGIFARNLAAFADALPPSMAASQAKYRAFLAKNAASATAIGSTTAHKYGSLWQGPVDPRAKPCCGKNPCYCCSLISCW